ADQEVDVLALDFESGRRQGSSGLVAAVVTVDQSLALVAGDRHLIGQRALRRPGSERLARDLPGAIILALEIGNEDVGPLGGPGPGTGRKENDQTKQAERTLHEWVLSATAGVVVSTRRRRNMAGHFQERLLSVSSSTAPRITKPRTTICV